MNSSITDEPLLSEENNRLTVYPIKQEKIWRVIHSDTATRRMD